MDPSTALVPYDFGGGDVSPFGCPDCGESRPDYLEIIGLDEDEVHCATCGAGYLLDATPIAPPVETRKCFRCRATRPISAMVAWVLPGFWHCSDCADVTAVLS